LGDAAARPSRAQPARWPDDGYWYGYPECRAEVRGGSWRFAEAGEEDAVAQPHSGRPPVAGWRRDGRTGRRSNRSHPRRWSPSPPYAQLHPPISAAATIMRATSTGRDTGEAWLAPARWERGSKSGRRRRRTPGRDRRAAGAGSSRRPGASGWAASPSSSFEKTRLHRVAVVVDADKVLLFIGHQDV